MLEFFAIIPQQFPRVRVPDPGTTLSLLSIAFGTLAFIRGKLNNLK